MSGPDDKADDTADDMASVKPNVKYVVIHPGHGHEVGAVLEPTDELATAAWAVRRAEPEPSAESAQEPHDPGSSE